jgi:SAM-dependent methyltransferase
VTLKRRIARFLPFKLASEAIYPRSYFVAIDEGQRILYARLADVVHERWAPASVVDVGCGTGVVLTHLSKRGVVIQGVDGSRSAIRASPVRDRIMRWNLERPIPDIGHFEVALCTEVAEHLPPRAAPTLVSSLIGLSDTIVFTAATPGQGGRHHLNEQPHSYWAHLFGERGFVRITEDESYIRERIRDVHEAMWIHDNLMVFCPRRS